MYCGCMNSSNQTWLLLIVTLPTNGATARMRIWRNLKSLGCGSLRDGVFLLPQSEQHAQNLRDLADETISEGGSAWVLALGQQSESDTAAFRFLFDRSAEYAQFQANLVAARKTLSTLGPQEITRLQRKLKREIEAQRAIDYFPGQAALGAEAAWLDFVHLAATVLSNDEPQAVDAAITRLDPALYQSRRWATRAHLWVDRVASAWLIARFIDRQACFLWLNSAADCPLDALGFDFDGATFTHVGERVTFEVLLQSFGLERDLALQGLASLVRSLDIGTSSVPEAAGFEAILSGARQKAQDDTQLFQEIGPVLDSLYGHFSNKLISRENAK